MNLRIPLSWFDLSLAFVVLVFLAAGCSHPHKAAGAGDGGAGAVAGPGPAAGADHGPGQPGAMAPSGVSAEDVAIAQSVSEVLSTYSDPGGLWSSVEATVESGSVTLRGSVPSEHQRIEIVQRVSRLPGVRRVHNKLSLSDQR